MGAQDVSPDLADSVNSFIQSTLTPILTVTLEIGEAVAKLWSDPSIKSAFEKYYIPLQIPWSASYFFDNIQRVMDKGYIPSNEDILQCRARTTGIQEVTFEVEGANFRMVDVGGQRSERRKWIHCFQNVTGVIFFVALSEYDQKLFEDEEVNRMHESIMLFSEICKCQWFTESALILFLNKCDLFREKIATTDLKVCFPDYTAGCNHDEALAFIRKKFVALNKNPDKEIFVHVTCATDTQMVSKVFSDVRETLRAVVFSDMMGEE